MTESRESTIGVEPGAGFVRGGEFPYRPTPAGETIRAGIKKTGPMPFSEFMRICLYGDDGYYSTGKAKIFAEAGHDFVTAPEVFRSVGYTYAEVARRVWERLGSPPGFSLIEMGAGRGTMAGDILERAELSHPDFFAALDYVILDYGGMISKQRERLEAYAARGKVEWVEGSAYQLPFSGVEGIFISNELPDAFPIEVVTRRGGRLVQKYVGAEEGVFVEYWGELAPEVSAYLDRFGLEVREGVEEPVNLRAAQFQEELNRALRRGLIVSADYGDEGASIGGGRACRAVVGGTGGMERAYLTPGEVDITADVNFRPLRMAAEADGLRVLVFRHADFMRAAGGWQIAGRLTREGRQRSPYHEVEVARLFGSVRVMAARKGIERIGFQGGIKFPLKVAGEGVREVTLVSFARGIDEEQAAEYLAMLEGDLDGALVELYERDRLGRMRRRRELEGGVLREDPAQLRGVVVLDAESGEVLGDFRRGEELKRLVARSGIGEVVDAEKLAAGEGFL